MKSATKRISIGFFALLSLGLRSTQGADRPRIPYVLAGDLPLYPPLAKTARVSGRVHILVTVRDGEVVAAEAKSGDPLLATAAKANIKTWKFEKGVNAEFETIFIYKLEKKESPKSSNPKIEIDLPRSVKITASPTKVPCQDCDVDIRAKPVETR